VRFSSKSQSWVSSTIPVRAIPFPRSSSFQAEAAKHGIEVVEATGSNSSGVHVAAGSLVGKVDAIHIPTDSTVVSAFEAVVKVCEESKIPLYAADIDSVPRSAVAAPWVGSKRKRLGFFTTTERIGNSSTLF
jgi:ABC-type uncharacterized transport system substrate-binding protein